MGWLSITADQAIAGQGLEYLAQENRWVSSVVCCCEHLDPCMEQSVVNNFPMPPVHVKRM